VNIVVCIKQVPDATEITIDPETKTLNRDAAPAILNPFDAYAIEEALQLTEKHGGTVTVISMGPNRAKEVIQEAFSLGVQQGVLICDPLVRGSDTFCTAKILAAAIKKIGNVDLVLCGKQAVDGDTAQVGPEIAELLSIPHVAYVQKVESVVDGTIRVQRMLENGYEIVEMELPGLLTVLKDINTPRLPSFKLVREARKKEIPVWGISDLDLSPEEVGLDGSPTTVVNTFTPELKSGGRMLEGNTQAKVQALLTEINQHLGNIKEAQ
jgi:electron transfer flavoprotein beta subunit